MAKEIPNACSNIFKATYHNFNSHKFHDIVFPREGGFIEYPDPFYSQVYNKCSFDLNNFSLQASLDSKCKIISSGNYSAKQCRAVIDFFLKHAKKKTKNDQFKQKFAPTFLKKQRIPFDVNDPILFYENLFDCTFHLYVEDKKIEKAAWGKSKLPAEATNFVKISDKLPAGYYDTMKSLYIK